MYAWMWKECVEPVKRNKDGLRWINHKFPIKGGISSVEAMRRDFRSTNTNDRIMSMIVMQKDESV